MPDSPEPKPRVIVIRHGATAYNSNTSSSKDERIRGHLNLPLTLEGLGEAHRLGQLFKGRAVQQIHSSDLQRALRTAEAIQEAHPWHPPIRKTQALRPWKLGPTIEGELVLEVLPRMMYLALVGTAIRPPGGESFDDYKSNFLPEFSSILALAKERPELGAHLVATHERDLRVADGWIRAGCNGLQIDPHVILAEKHIPTGGWLELEFDGEHWVRVGESKPVSSASGEFQGGLVG